MNSVDNKIVAMEFDNKQFQKGVETTINSIDDLKKSLKFDGVEKGFDKIDKGIGKLDFSKVNSALHSITYKFSTLGTVADQTIRNITKSIELKLLKALKEVSGIITGTQYAMEGFKEYELKIGSIQTIAANTGALKNYNKTVEETVKLTESEEEVAKRVAMGDYGVGADRFARLAAEGYDASKIQQRVNKLVSEYADVTGDTGKKVQTTLKDIDVALDGLNEYADKTIYSFSQMTSAIGRFTTAGIDLETSTEMVKGLSNLAALSGATNTNLQSSLYNFSQAMQKGSMQLMDWRSIENAGMASAQFKEAIMDTARVHGIAIDQMIDENGNFNETLKERWLTKDILVESLSKLTAFTTEMTEEEREAERARWREIGYTEAQIKDIEELSRIAYESATKVRTFTQLIETTKEEIGSSYSMMWQNIIGNFDEATNLWTSVHDAIQKHFITPMTEARDAKWKFFHDNGGREAAIEGLTNVGKGLLTIIHAISDAWYEVFPKDDGHRITALAKGFAEFSKRLVVSDETAKKIKITFQGLFSVVHIFTSAIGLVVKVVGLLIKTLGRMANTNHPILSLTANIGQLLINLDKFLTDSDNIQKVLDGLSYILEKLADVLAVVVDKTTYFVTSIAAPKFINLFDNLREHVHNFVKGSEEDVNSIGESDTSGVEKFSDRIKNRLNPIGNAISNVFEGIKNIVTKIWGWIKDTFTKIKNLIVESKGKVSLATVIEAILGGELFLTFVSIKKFFDNASKTLGGVKDILKGVHDVLEAYALNIKANVLLKIAGAVTMLVGSIIALSLIDSNKLWNAVKAMSVLIGELAVMTVILSKFSDGLMVQALASDSKLGNQLFNTNVGTILLKIAEAILVLSASLFVLSYLDPNRLATGLAAISAIMIVVSAFMAVLSKISKESKPSALFAISAMLFTTTLALTALLVPIIAFSLIPSEKISKASAQVIKIMASMSVALLFMATISRIAQPSAMLATAGALMIMTVAINSMIIPIIILSLLPINGLWDAVGVLMMLITVFGAMVSVIAYVTRKSLASDLLSVSVTIIALATGINMLMIPLLILALLPINNLMQAALAMGAIFFAIGLLIKSISNDSNNKAKVLGSLAMAVIAISSSILLLLPYDWTKVAVGALAIAAVSAAIALMLKQLKNPVKQSKGLMSIALTIGVMAISLVALSKIKSKTLLISVGSLILLLGAITGFGAIVGRFPLIVSGLTSLSIALIEFGVAMSLIGAGGFLIFKSLKLLADTDFSNIGVNVAELIGGLAAGIYESGPAFIAACTTILLALIKMVADMAAPTIDAIVKVIQAILRGIVNLIDDIADAVIKIIVGILGAIERNMDDIIAAIFGILIALFNSIGNWLSDDERCEELRMSIWTFIAGLLNLLVGVLKDLWYIVTDALKELFSPLTDWAYDEGSNIIGGLVDGFKDAWNGLKGWVNDAVDWLGDRLASIGDKYDEIKNKLLGEKFEVDPVGYQNALIFSKLWNTSLENAYQKLSSGDMGYKTAGDYLGGLTKKGWAETNGTDYEKTRVHAYKQIQNAIRQMYTSGGYDINGVYIDPFWTSDALLNAFDFDEYGNLIVSRYMEGELHQINLGANFVTEKVISDYLGNHYKEFATKRDKNLEKDLYDSAYETASQAGKGYAEGVTAGYENQMDIHSPAKNEQLVEDGENTTKGLVNGMMNIIPDSVGKFTDSLTGSIGDKLGSYDMSNMLNADNIVPGSFGSDINTSSILSMDDYMTSVPDVEGHITYTEPSIPGKVDFGDKNLTNDLALDVSNQMSEYEQQILNTTTDIYNELSSLRSYISELKIQLDTGALVGSLKGPMDTALGEMAAQKARGV